MKQKNSAEATVVITDANILIDLKNANLVGALLRTEWRVITTDFVFEELNPSTIAVDSFGIEVINLSGIEIAEIFEIRQNHNRLIDTRYICTYTGRENRWHSFNRR